MRRTNLEKWIEATEGIPHLTREALEALQLQRLNETLARVKAREGFYREYPERLNALSDLQKLPFTTAEDLSGNPGKFLLTSQSEVSRVISGATSGTTGPAKRVFYTQADTEKTIGLFTAGIPELVEKCFISFRFKSVIIDFQRRQVVSLVGIGRIYVRRLANKHRPARYPKPEFFFFMRI